MSLKVLGIGMALPDQVVTNDDLAKIMDTNDEWIRSRTGIEERRISADNDTCELAVRSAREAVAEVSQEVLDTIDMVVVATLTADTLMPQVSAHVHHKLGLHEADFFALDMNMACTGFVGALRIAHGCLAPGRCALVIGADVLSKVLDFTDRSMAILFGDGAGCLLVRKEDGPMHFHGGSVVDETVIHMTGRTIGDNGTNVDPYMHMAGQETYRFAVTKVPETLKELSEISGLALDDVDHYVLHQANWRILEQTARRLKQPIEKFAKSLDSYGNTSASSIPLALYDLHKAGKLKENDLIFMAGFGGGLHYMSTYLRW